MPSDSIWERKAQSSRHDLQQRSNPSTATQSDMVQNFARTCNRAVFVGFGKCVLVGWLLLVGLWVWSWGFFLSLDACWIIANIVVVFGLDCRIIKNNRDGIVWLWLCRCMSVCFSGGSSAGCSEVFFLFRPRFLGAGTGSGWVSPSPSATLADRGFGISTIGAGCGSCSSATIEIESGVGIEVGS